MSILLIGEAPGKGGRPGEPALLGRIGARLTRLMDITPTQYLYGFERVNLLPRWPGKASGNGSAWPAKRARVAARRMEDAGTFGSANRDRIVVLLGRRVATAFGFGHVSWFKPFQHAHVVIVVAPHPSGASRWWNDPRNVARARQFWRGIIAEHAT